MVQRLQDSPLLPFVDHLAPAKVTRILPEDREPGKGIITLSQFVQVSNSCIIKLFRQYMPQPLPFFRKNPAYQVLKRGITGPDNFMFVEPDNQLRGNKTGGYIPMNNVGGLLFKL